MKKCLAGLTVVLVLLMACPAGWADVMDPFDNISAPPGAFALVNYFGYQHYPEFELEDGTEFDIGVDAAYLAIRPVYFAGKVFGMTWGVNAIVPLVHVSMDYAPSGSGMGDLVVGPFIFLYENPDDMFYVSFWEFAYTPTGADDVTVVGDSWMFQHQLAIGWYPGPWSLDIGLNYWQRDEDADELDLPDAFEFEGVLAYGITEKFRMGVNWAWWKDLEESDDTDLEGENLKLGLNLGYTLQENIILNLRYMHDVDSEDYTKGSWTYFRILYLF